LQGIQRSDSLVAALWAFLKTDSVYRNKVTLLVTNDHGRHLDGLREGFVSHGDNCEGCRHITLFAAGPDFKRNTTIHTYNKQSDLTATAAELLGFTMSTEGQVMWDLFPK